MSTPLFLLIAPLLIAAVVYLGLRRWPRAAGVCGFLAAVAIALLLSSADLQAGAASSAFISGNELTFFERTLLLTEGLRRIMLLILAGSSLLFLLSARWSQGPDFVPVAFAALAPLAFAIMVTPLAFGAVALLLVAALLAALVQGQRPGSTLASLRYLILTALAVPALLVAGWMLDSQQLALSAVIWRLFLLGAALLLAGFPFHIWVRPLLNEAYPLTAVFVLAPVQLGTLTFLWRWLQLDSQVLLGAQLGAALGWSGAATALLAAFMAYTARDPRRLLGSLVLVDMGATLICFGHGIAGIEQAWALLLTRYGALLIAAIGLQWSAQQEAVDASLVGAEHLARHPLAAALVAYGALSLIGLPLTPGFATRWAAMAVAGSASIWWSLPLVLAVAAGLAGVLRVYAPIVGAHSFDPSALQSFLQSLLHSRRYLPLALYALAILLLAALSLYPWPFLNIISNLNELF